MATPNYGYEKRQKELAKKRKKEEKLRAKAERKQGQGGGADPASQDLPADESPAPNGASSDASNPG
ncbi:MAG: hypothetical protein OJF60_002052 [Burkholderiaceae bacterium]|nr:MAG: hypothetical protein OJF60_002052 [Burkholderiaceae bacterium]